MPKALALKDLGQVLPHRHSTHTLPVPGVLLWELGAVPPLAAHGHSQRVPSMWFELLMLEALLLPHAGGAQTSTPNQGTQPNHRLQLLLGHPAWRTPQHQP